MSLTLFISYRISNDDFFVKSFWYQWKSYWNSSIAIQKPNVFPISEVVFSLQLAVAIMFVIIGGLNINKDRNKKAALILNDIILVFIFLIAIVNILISGFGMEYSSQDLEHLWYFQPIVLSLVDMSILQTWLRWKFDLQYLSRVFKVIIPFLLQLVILRFLSKMMVWLKH